jgi:hypothetical protein
MIFSRRLNLMFLKLIIIDFLLKICYNVVILTKKLSKKIKRTVIGSTLAFIGFVLSPLTWWNDLFVNLPLAFGFAYIIGLILSAFVPVTLLLFIALMAIGYFLSNMLGFLLMHKGVVTVANKSKKQFYWEKNLLYSILAFGLVVLSIHFGLLDLGETEKLSASILKVHYLK